MVDLTDLVSLALPAAASLEQATIYDVSYMLVARQQECDYITADKRFYKKAHQTFSFVKYYEDVQ
jgi:predicted nucleic acid-binding protein